jgi:8-oxo-dGTP pyrophosphatase MutT (NUDIX family)
MLHLIPEPLHRLALRVAHAVRRRWWRVARVRLEGCRILALDSHGRVLLIRHSYGSGMWLLPGGGIARGEASLTAALRELAEETGLDLVEPRCLAVLDEPLYGTTNRVHLFSGTAQGTLRCDGREVIEAKFFAPTEWPDDLSPRLARQLAGWLDLAEA